MAGSQRNYPTTPPTGGGGTVTDVTAGAPLASSGGTTPNITITQAGAGSSGYLSQADWATFNGKASTAYADAAAAAAKVGGVFTIAFGLSLIGFTIQTNEYFGIGSAQGLASSNPDDILPFVVPCDGLLKDLQLRSNSTSPASSTMELTLYRSPGGSNTLTYAATALVIPVGISVKYAEDVTHSLSVTRGDCLLFRINEPWLTTGLIITGRLVPTQA